MQKTYLKDFKRLQKTSIAYVPIGTLEWHGHQLPIETDALLAEARCKEVARRVKGYVLPTFYLGTDNSSKKGKNHLYGMDEFLGKKMPGSLYFLKPKTLENVLTEVVQNLKRQEFKYIFLISGHAGPKHIETLLKVSKKFKKVYVPRIKAINHRKSYLPNKHAAEGEISLFLGYYPEETPKIKKIKLSKNDEYVRFRGWNPIPRIDILEGKKMVKAQLESIVSFIKEKVKNN